MTKTAVDNNMNNINKIVTRDITVNVQPLTVSQQDEVKDPSSHGPPG